MGAAGMSPEEEAKNMAENVLSRLPAKVFSGTPHETAEEMQKMSPMSIVLIQEGARYTKLLVIITTSLKAVIDAVQGIQY